LRPLPILAMRRDLPDAQTTIERFNRELVRMRADGTYNDALQVTWIYADVDGDGRAELVSASEQLGTQPPHSAYPVWTLTSGGGVRPSDPGTARFVVEGVFYDTWDAVPDEYKRNPPDLAL